MMTFPERWPDPYAPSADACKTLAGIVVTIEAARHLDVLLDVAHGDPALSGIFEEADRRWAEARSRLRHLSHVLADAPRWCSPVRDLLMLVVSDGTDPRQDCWHLAGLAFAAADPTIPGSVRAHFARAARVMSEVFDAGDPFTAATTPSHLDPNPTLVPEGF
ncbi:hypothetical protein LGQ03_13335 [Loktanella sp. TSTF-M6]|uniref:Uncharacterized protein n=1 Tax=Loktanella gaetbuli TaxID=2881335 RepID=A0ABS8BWW2_9RHOB|nr:hypothetical protein [Loktanella gaetbuli]MCB5200228.1 hypothetical protein [Loktanella gaetbuli]